MLPCLNKKLFGFECMGCGLQRSVLFVFRGQFTDAFHMYPAVYPLILLFSFVGLGFFVKVKHAQTITIVLSILSILTIIISYIYKLMH